VLREDGHGVVRADPVGLRCHSLATPTPPASQRGEGGGGEGEDTTTTLARGRGDALAGLGQATRHRTHDGAGLRRPGWGPPRLSVGRDCQLSRAHAGQPHPPSLREAAATAILRTWAGAPCVHGWRPPLVTWASSHAPEGVDGEVLAGAAAHHLEQGAVVLVHDRRRQHAAVPRVVRHLHQRPRGVDACRAWAASAPP
jgi:hypothetical protein